MKEYQCTAIHSFFLSSVNLTSITTLHDQHILIISFNNHFFWSYTKTRSYVSCCPGDGKRYMHPHNREVAEGSDDQPALLCFIWSATKNPNLLRQLRDKKESQFTASTDDNWEKTAARFLVHIPRSSLEFLSAVFYSACSDLCSQMEEGEFWFLCNFKRFNPLQSLYLLVS